jgi:hypothetical protein
VAVYTEVSDEALRANGRAAGASRAHALFADREARADHGGAVLALPGQAPEVAALLAHGGRASPDRIELGVDHDTSKTVSLRGNLHAAGGKTARALFARLAESAAKVCAASARSRLRACPPARTRARRRAHLPLPAPYPPIIFCPQVLPTSSAVFHAVLVAVLTEADALGVFRRLVQGAAHGATHTDSNGAVLPVGDPSNAMRDFITPGGPRQRAQFGDFFGATVHALLSADGVQHGRPDDVSARTARVLRRALQVVSAGGQLLDVRGGKHTAQAIVHYGRETYESNLVVR